MPNKLKKPDALLRGRHLLIVEDNFLILLELEAVLRDAGAETVQTCRTVKDALARADEETLSAGILDVRIGPDSVAPVARRLAARGAPFVFYTGQVENNRLLAEWPNCKIISKPAPPHVIVNAVARLLTA
jgi:DNA-binding NarL/FixJ family response regulator